METTLGEDAMNTVEMTTKTVEYYIVYKAEFERTDSTFEKKFCG